MLQKILALSALPWLRALFTVAVLSAIFVWWRGRASEKATAHPQRVSPTSPSSALLAPLSEQLKLAAADVHQARRVRGRGGQRMYLYGARQRLETIAAAAGGDEETLARISVRANLSMEKLGAYVEKALLMIDREGP